MYYLSLLFTTLIAFSSAGWTDFNGNFVMTTASGGAGTVTGSVIWSWTQGKMYLAFNTGVSGSSWTETYDWNSTHGFSGAGTDNPQYLFTYGSTCSPNCAAASISTGQPPLNPSGSYLSAASGSGPCYTYYPSASASNSFMVSMTASSTALCSFKLTDGRSFTMTSFTQSASTITTPSGCSCSQSVDIMFLVDHSQSISTAQMGQFKTFVTNFLGNLTISSSAVNVGMTYFSKATTQYTNSNFPMTGTPSVVTSGMNGWAVPCTGSANTCVTQAATATPYGIQVAANALYSSVRQVPKILMTLTDGATNTDANNNGCCLSSGTDRFTGCNPSIDTAMTYLQNKKTAAGYSHTLTLIAVGVGTECTSSDKSGCTPTCKYSPHLLKFAGGVSANVLSVNDWTALQSQVANLMSLTCSTSNNAQQNTCLETCGGLCVCGGCSPPTGCSNSSACFSYALTGNPAQCQATAIPCAARTCQVSTCNTTLNACTYAPVDCSGYKGGCNNCSKYTCATSGSTIGQCTVQDNSGCGAAVDCVQSDWGSWTTCTATCGGGTATATRTNITQPQNCGAACGATTQTFSCNTQTCSTPCTVSTWSDWGPCTATCGGGTQTSTRTITANATNGGTACPTLTQSQTCGNTNCPVDCVWYTWGAWSPCSLTCGGGSTTETRSIQTQAQYGGNTCSGNSTNTTSCNNNPCPIDCVWSTWGDYGSCSKTCGSGSQTRTRTQTPPASYGGANCTGNSSDTATCNTNGCPVNCTWGPWGMWGSCSVSCAAGTQTQTRSTNQSALNGGVDCKASDGTNTSSCNNGPCPINCVWGDWGAWGVCTVSCGGGTQISKRNITTQAQYGGQNCTGASNQSQTCQTNGCPVNCTWSAWGALSPCTKSCGNGTNTRTRYVVNASANGGTQCNLTDDTLYGVCNTTNCPVDCVWSTWSAFGICSKTCGGGSQQSTRTITTNSAYGGAACGNISTQNQTCNSQNCPIDCVGAWTPWANCSCLYQNQSRTYSISTPAQYNGTDCPNDNGDVESQGCNVTSCVPLDCVGAWGPNSTCSCADNSTYQVFTITVPAANNGTECNYTTGATRSFYCDPTGCPVDCSGHWTNETECACVVNTSTSTFIIDVPAENNGLSCAFLNGTVNTTTGCTPSGCPVDCQGQWSSWTTCDCGTNAQNRTFTQTVAKQFAGADCNPAVGTLVSQSCNPSGCPVNCQGFYSEFSLCACATNTSVRTWTITTNASNGGVGCNDTNQQVESVPCVAQECPADCVGHWTAYGNCDCGNSQYNRTYVVDYPARYGGAGCEADDGDIGYGSCTPQNCPVPCAGYWSSWGTCDCSNSSKTRVFYVTNASQNGGASCDPPANLTIGTIACTPSGCPVDCVGGWSSWSVCSCATGNQTRSFSITVPRQFAGANCTNAQGDKDYQSCNTTAAECPVDCQGSWTEWSVCSCSTSRQTRNWNETVAAQFGGVACPGQQAQACDPIGCPVDCEGQWGEWGSCPCSGTSADGTTSSTKNRTYIETTTALFGGKNCSPTNGTIGTASCTAYGCPVDCVGEWGSWGNCSCLTLTKTRTFTITRNQSNGGLYCEADQGAIGSLSCDPGNCPVYPPDCAGPNDTTSCIDSSACTQNLCILFDDNKYHCDWSTPVDCNDNSVCTSDSCDEVKGCQYIPKVCNDNTACTVDTCDNVTGCVFTNVTCEVNATEWCAVPICDAVTGCGKATRICPTAGQTDNCTQMICDPNAKSNATACQALQLCGFDPVIAAVITAGAIAGIAVGCGIVALGAVSGASYAIATQTGAAAAVHTQGNPLYEASNAAGTNLMGENPN